MKQITLAVHPMTRQVLLAEYGAEPISIGQRDILFSMLSFTQLRARVELEKIQGQLTAWIDLEVHDALARHLQRSWYLVGPHLFLWHKDQMCRYTDACVRLGREAKASLHEWLSLFRVEEDQYGAEAAYKCWQRWNEKIQVRNPVFFEQMRDKAARKVPKKIAIKKDLTWSVPDVHVELVASRFAELAAAYLRQVPKRLHQQARIYFYRRLQGLSERQTGEKLNIPYQTVGYASRMLRNWADNDPVIEQMLSQAAAYQEK